MKAYFFSLLILSISLTSGDLHAYDRLFSTNTRQDGYGYENTDCNQKRVAAGMYIWGFMLFCGIVISSLVIPNDPSTTSKATQGQSSDDMFNNVGVGGLSSAIGT